MLESGHAASDVRDVEWPAELISALMGYNSILELNAISKVHWPAKLFSMDKNSSNLVTKAFPLLGLARFLVYGPRLGLPKGKWMATVSLAVADNSSGDQIAIAISKTKDKKPGQWGNRAAALRDIQLNCLLLLLPLVFQSR